MENHKEVDAVTKTMMLTAAAVIIIAGMRAAEPILVPFMMSVFLAVLCAPSLDWLQRRNVPAGVAILLIMLAILVFGTLLGALLGTSLSNFSEQLPLYQSRLQEMSGTVLATLTEYGLEVPKDTWKNYFDPGILMGLAGQVFASFGNVMTNAFLILLTVIFILTEMSVFRDKLEAVSDERNLANSTFEDFIAKINQYMALKCWVSLLTAFVITLGLWIIGVDFPLLWGVLAFLLNFVPNLGSIIAAVPAVLLALVQLGVVSAGLTAGLYVAVNVIVGNVLEPRFMGKGLNISTLVVFLSLVFWGWILGPVGMLLSIPLTMAVKIGLETNEDTHWIGIMLGSEVPKHHSHNEEPADVQENPDE